MHGSPIVRVSRSDGSAATARGRPILQLAPRTPIPMLLRAALADVIDLETRVRHVHWKARSKGCDGLATDLHRCGGELAESADDLGRRLVAIGARPVATAAQVAQLSRLPELTSALASLEEQTQALLASYQAAARHMSPAIDVAILTNDQQTASILKRAADRLERHRAGIEAELARSAGRWPDMARKA